MLQDHNKNNRWSNYWKQGFVTSFGKATTDNYNSGVKDFWFRQFGSLANEAVILDLATGNGAIAIVAVEYSEKFSKNFTVLAADAAVINNSIVEESKALDQYRNKIKFFSSTPCEHLSFEDSSVDMVCSQFGIEYSFLPDSIPEVSRVLRNEGKFTAIMHHQESVILLKSLQDQTMIKEAVYEHKVFDILRQYFKVFGDTIDAASMQIARQKPRVVNCEKKLWAVITSLREKYPDSEAVKNLLGTINKFTIDNISKPEEERLAKLEGLFDTYSGMIERQNDLQNAAMSQEAIINLQSLAAKSGFKDFTYEKNINSSFQINGWNVSAHM